ncbi:unnamed protein product [Agarophyton chilense]|eukprot:gb/GEZJ01004847.1/.p1 GENE.gb/GEZJ01004847.1/~~gb/GEZJ01004847.1/.p1  ORF type:complete len:573 (+),score=73.31 gb/GEZJ01004847.1/:101-1819(+)
MAKANSRQIQRRFLQNKSEDSVFKFLLLLAVLITVSSLTFIQFALTKLTNASVFSARRRNVVSPPPSVSIWSPKASCSGTFTSATADHSDPPFPSVVIRDAVVDHRYLSMRQFKDVHPSIPFTRIILYTSVHLSTSLTREDATAQLLVQNSSSFSLRAHVDYVTRVDPFLILGPYKSKKKTKRGHQVSEWQVAVSIRPAAEESELTQDEFTQQIRSLAKENGAVLSLVLPLKRFDGVIQRFDPAFDLGCVTDWESPHVYPANEKLNGEPECYYGLGDVSGTLLVSGSALYGVKKTDPRCYREIAHFAARALQGHLRYDTVAMSIVVNNSYSDRDIACGDDNKCHGVMRKRNYDLLENVRRVVESVFDEILLARPLWNRLILVPYGRLGSDANGTEASDPGRSSHRYGQYHATFFTYAMLSPYFKWAVSYDMDEFIARVPFKRRYTVSSENAEDVLDRATSSLHGYAYFTWLNFLVPDNSSNKLTEEIMKGSIPVLNGDRDCYALGRDPTGKSAVRCDVGLGFTIHRPVIRQKSSDPTILNQIQGERRSNKLRTWHPRIGRSSSKCIFVPKGI